MTFLARSPLQSGRGKERAQPGRRPGPSPSPQPLGRRDLTSSLSWAGFGPSPGLWVMFALLRTQKQRWPGRGQMSLGLTSGRAADSGLAVTDALFTGGD